MYSIKITTALVVCAFLFIASKNDKKAEPSKEDLLIRKTWKVIAYTSYNNMVTVAANNEEYAQLADCEKDNIFTFLSNKKYIIDEGLTKCHAEDPEKVEEGTWSLTGNKLTFIDSDLSAPYQFDILELTAQNLKLKLDLQESGSENVATKIITFAAQ